MDYIDLLLIHEPTGDVHEIYRAMETFYREGKIRAIGISNFMQERYLDLVNNSKVIPAVNQVETHVFRQQRKPWILNWSQKKWRLLKSWKLGKDGVMI